MNEMPSKGNLSEASLPKVLISLHRQRATGTLAVSLHGLRKKVFLRKGDAVFASSNFDDDRLGEMLLKAGKITVEQYDKSVEMLKRTKMRQGAILVKLGFLTPKDLFWGVKYQVRQIVYSVFHLEGADYEFAEGEMPKDEVITLNMSMGNLIYEGVKTISNWTRIRAEMPPMESVLQLNSDPLSLFQDVELSPQDKKILSLVDGKRDIKTVIEESWLNSFEALKALYILWSLGIITEKRVEVSPVSLEELLEPFTEEEETFMLKVNSLYGRLGRIDNHKLLEIDRSASLEDVRKNYYRLAKEFHPDRFYRSNDTTLRDKLSAIFDAITDAYNVLKETRAAAKGEEALAEGGLDAALSEFGLDAGAQEEEFVFEEPAPRTEEAEEKFKAGLDAIKKGDIETASRLLGEAAEADPENAEYWSCLALAQSRRPGRMAEAEAAMLKALEIEPSNSDYYANLGLLYLKTKDWERARTQFEKALMLDPENPKAAKGLRQLGG